MASINVGSPGYSPGLEELQQRGGAQQGLGRGGGPAQLPGLGGLRQAVHVVHTALQELKHLDDKEGVRDQQCIQYVSDHCICEHQPWRCAPEPQPQPSLGGSCLCGRGALGPPLRLAGRSAARGYRRTQQRGQGCSCPHSDYTGKQVTKTCCTKRLTHLQSIYCMSKKRGDMSV